MTLRLTTYLICLILMASCSSGSAEPEVKPSAVMVVDELVPDYGPPGTEVTIKGNNFSTVLSENTVKFGDTQVEIISASKIELKVIAPDMPVGDVYDAGAQPGTEAYRSQRNLTQLVEVLKTLKEQAQAVDTEPIVMVNGAPTTPHQRIVDVMAALSEAGISTVGLNTSASE